MSFISRILLPFRLPTSFDLLSLPIFICLHISIYFLYHTYLSPSFRLSRTLTILICFLICLSVSYLTHPSPFRSWRSPTPQAARSTSCETATNASGPSWSRDREAAGAAGAGAGTSPTPSSSSPAPSPSLSPSPSTCMQEDPTRRESQSRCTRVITPTAPWSLSRPRLWCGRGWHRGAGRWWARGWCCAWVGSVRRGAPRTLP